MSFIENHMSFLSRPRLLNPVSWFKGLSVSRRWQNRLAILLIIAAIASGIATYAALTETPPLGNDPDTVIWLLNLDLLILLMLVAMVAWRIVGLWSGRRRKLAGSHLHVRLVYTFSLLAAVPAITMTIFSAFFFHFGVQTWFSERVQTAINESQAVAEAYLQEHKQIIRADALAMANDLDRQARYLLANDGAFEKIVQTQSLLRNFSEAIVFDLSGRILARSGLTFSLEFEEVPKFALQQAEGGEVVVMTGGNDDRVRALIKLNNFINTFLYVGRMVDPKVLSHVTATRQASEDYADLRSKYSELQVSFIAIFVVIGLLLMMGAIWMGLLLARQLVKPISALILTSDRVRAGDLSARVPDQENLEEFDYLARSFNRMTKQIQEQQNELLEANRQMDRRRRFTETVLEGVSSGIIGLDNSGAVTLANSSALKLLDKDEHEILQKPVQEIVPEFEEIMHKAHEQPLKITQAEIPVLQADGSKRTFLIRIAIELIDEKDMGAVITFDDITEFQSAQRKAAWADVARRIAHEIKNPLTPIQLSAERLKRKYLKQITDDPETFVSCTDTIIKQVGDIGHMVNEFSSFARMPEPRLQHDDLSKHIQDTVFLHKQAHSHIVFSCALPADPVTLMIDPQQIRQALNNLLQNSIDSIDARLENEGESAKTGQISVVLHPCGDGQVAVVIADNGLGLPKDETPESLAEPYVTRKEKGTGLGLAIVKKIMEDHNGHLFLETPGVVDKIENWKDLGGAAVTLVFPVEHSAATAAKKADAA